MFPIWDKTITLYNRIVNTTAETVTWQKRVLENCFVSSQSLQQQVGNELYYVKNFLVRIPESKDYVDPDAWESLSSRTSKFTLADGSLVFVGAVNFTITDESGHRPNDYLEAHKSSSFKIKSFKDNTHAEALRHYRIEGF